MKENQNIVKHAPPVLEIEIIRSARRKKSVSAELKGDVIVVRAPKRMSSAELEPIIQKLKTRLERQLARKSISRDQEDLEKLARQMNREYFSGKLKWNSIRYVTNQNKRFGSCTPSQGTIRISHRVGKMPLWVLKYVLVHELAHLKEANHGPRFWALVNRYPLTERARGYLMAVGLEDEE